MIEPIVDEAGHAKALERIHALWDAEAGTPEGAELETLARLVDAYERRVFDLGESGEAQPFRGMPVSGGDPTAPAAAEDWEAGR
jgi:HTH-type transcriptional regulator/antitoxin HigA